MTREHDRAELDNAEQNQPHDGQDQRELDGNRTAPIVAAPDK
ncbi:MAG: hypothetical protein O2967_03515 [Proteobacteria bacterium]|nr:hypothetical protein [Pseudomonadota bacterium]